jgi:TM2 domain-containing membrane protein YozV/predicted transcriptional regulator
MNKVGVTYALWLGGLVGLSGLHRLYNGQIKTGLLWLCTFGLFGFGQLFDLVLIPEMVKVHNTRLGEQYDRLLQQNPIALKIENAVLRPPKYLAARSPKLIDSMPMSRQEMTIELLRVAAAKGGKLSVTQGVMATGMSFQHVEMLLKEMLKSGYVEISNDPETGIVLYEFREL